MIRSFAQEEGCHRRCAMPASQTIVIAGGSGLIGRALVEALVGGGQEVVLLSRSPRPASTPGVRTARWDGVRVEPGWARELAGAAGVVNLAGASIGGRRWTRRRRETILQSRLRSTDALVEAIAGLE